MTEPAEIEPAAEDAGSEAETEPFANRAARRAKGKAKDKQELGAAGARQLRSGPVQSQRNYGNRRSG